MRQETVTHTLYTFEELSEKAQEKALEKLWSINVDFDWWDSTYEDAKTIGLTITEFDTDRGNKISGKFFKYPRESANLILVNHGAQCDTYKIAESFLRQWKEFSGDERESEVGEELQIEFERAIKEEYLHILRKEYEYLTSKGVVIESINSNEYEFLEDGTFY